MKRRLQRIYWAGISVTLVLAFLAVGLMVNLKIHETKEFLVAMLKGATAMTIESNSDLQTLADKIAEISPPVRVTYLMNHGMPLADSAVDVTTMGNQIEVNEIAEALTGVIGQDLRFSDTEKTFTLFVAGQISPQLILRISYPIREITHILFPYSGGLVLLFFLFFIVQKRSVKGFVSEMIRQMDEVRELLESGETKKAAIFPEFQPVLDNIGYLTERIQNDMREINRTLKLRSDFVANASHELRSPLTSIMGFAEMLDEGLADSPEEQAICIQTIRSECSRMLKVIEDILHLSKEERKQHEATETVNVADVTEEILTALAHRAAQKRIKLEKTGELVLDTVEKDIWEILYNLVDNAVRYGKEGGFVRVELSDRSIVVRDDGIGIPPEHVPHIFEQFYRVETQQDSDVRGTGLGLSIVRTIVQRNGGTIRVESTPGEGSSFIIDFESEEEHE